MKRYTFLVAIITMILLQGCTHDYYTVVDNSDKNYVLEVTTSFNAGNNFSKLVPINPPIYTSDMILVYQLYDVSNGSDIWRLLPQTYYFDNGGELDYNFDFTINDVNIWMDANFDMTALDPVWTQNQTFRIVIIPGYFSGKSSKSVDFKDYNATIKAYNINPLNVKKI